jgi:hypothetical protein
VTKLVFRILQRPQNTHTTTTIERGCKRKKGQSTHKDNTTQHNTNTTQHKHKHNTNTNTNTKHKTQNTKHKTQKHKTQHTKHTNTKHKTQKHKTQNTKAQNTKTQNTKTQKQKHKTRNTKNTKTQKHKNNNNKHQNTKTPKHNNNKQQQQRERTTNTPNTFISPMDFFRDATSASSDFIRATASSFSRRMSNSFVSIPAARSFSARMRRSTRESSKPTLTVMHDSSAANALRTFAAHICIWRWSKDGWCLAILNPLG